MIIGFKFYTFSKTDDQLFKTEDILNQRPIKVTASNGITLIALGVTLIALSSFTN